MVSRWIKYVSPIKVMVVSILVLMCASIVQAMGVQVQDDAGAFSSDEIGAIESNVSDLEDETGWDLIVLTTMDAGGNTSNEYGERFYNANKETEDGIVLVLDFDNGKKAIVTSGEAIYYLTDARIENVLASADPYSGTEQYADMILAMCAEIESCYEAGADGNYKVDEATGEITYYEEPNNLSGLEALLSLVIALVAGGLFVGFIVGKYRLKFGEYKYSFRANGTVDLKMEQDYFVNQFVTRRCILDEDDNDGGGGSSVHSGAGGGSFGGGSSDL